MYRILLLEDDDNLRPVLADVLEEEGFEVDSCQAGDAAIEMARQSEYDLMVADIRMEGLDGLAALSQVQSYRPGVDALVISGYADAEQAERASRLGLGAVLKKPFQLDVFLHKVNVLLKARSQKLSVHRAFESLLRTSFWSSRQLARFLDNAPKQVYDFSQLLEVTGLLCTEMNLLGSQLEKIRSAALAAAWQQSSKAIGLDPPEDLPQEFQQWFEFLGEWWNGSGPQGLGGTDIPLESRIIVAALVVCRCAPDDDPEEKWPGRFDPTLLRIIDRGMKLSPEKKPQETSDQSSESLLDLARTLLRTGDFHHATEALQEVVQREAESPEGVDALLLLARLKQRSGLFEEAKQMAFRTPELAQSFGPALAARAHLECGRLLMDLSERTHARATLEKAQSLFTRLGLSTHAAECGLLADMVGATLAENAQTQERLDLLLQPQHRAHAGKIAEPLTRALLAEPNLPEPVQRSLARLMLAHPHAARSALSGSTEALQERSLAVIQKAGPQKYTRVLEALQESSHKAVRGAARQIASSHSSEKNTLPLNVTTLGGLLAEVGDRQVPDRAWKTNKVRYLFARLVEAYPTPVQEEVLIEEFWPGDVEKGRRSLYTATSSIRSALRKSGLESQDYVEKALNGLVLAPDITLNYDLAELRETVAEAARHDRAGNVQEAVVGYRRAVLDGEKPYLPDCYNDWALNLRHTVQQQLLEACVRLTEISFANERHHEVLEFARRALSLEPSNETATGLLLASLIQLGRPAEAVKRHQTFCEVLEEELGISEATTLEKLVQRATNSVRK